MLSNKSRPHLIVAVLLLGVFASFDALAVGFDLKLYREGMALPAKREQIKIYVDGLRDGITLLDSYPGFESIKGKFCIAGANLTGQKTIAILDLEIADPTNGKPYPDDMPIVFVLIKALERFAPCNSVSSGPAVAAADYPGDDWRLQKPGTNRTDKSAEDQFIHDMEECMLSPTAPPTINSQTHQVTTDPKLLTAYRRFILSCMGAKSYVLVPPKP